jgi:hypothetical protein
MTINPQADDNVYKLEVLLTESELFQLEHALKVRAEYLFSVSKNQNTSFRARREFATSARICKNLIYKVKENVK